MSAPRWTRALLRRVAPPGAAEDVLGDLEEAHRGRVQRHGRVIASTLAGLEALDMAVALIRMRIRGGGAPGRSTETEDTMVVSKRNGPMVSWIDVKLGARMLVKYPALSLVGGLGMTVVIAIGAVFASIVGIYYATLPFEEGERVVAIENWDVEVNNQERQILHDFVEWRDELESVEDLGAYRTVERNLVVPGGSARPVTVAEMTASGFGLARVQPLVGRTLIPEDEEPGASPAVVIGYEVWQTRFAGDPDIIGRTVGLGDTRHTVVGVMPDGFEFPLVHEVWVPFRMAPSDYVRGEGPGIRVFGRLAPGYTLEEAQAELTTVGQRMAAAFPETHERLRPRIVSYSRHLFDSGEGGVIPAAQILVILLLLEVCVNIAILVYARTATRQGEIGMRSALGASRRRIVGQLFVEALVLSTAAAAVGLGVAGVVLRQIEAIFAQQGFLPFWMEFDLSAATVVYAMALTVLAAAIVGVVPALKVTGRRVQTGLQRLSAGGSGMRFGRTWTVLVVAQVAVAVAILPTAVFYAGEFIRDGIADPGFAAKEFLTARLEMDRETPPSAEAEAYQRAFASRYADLQAELVRRLDAEPGITDVSFAMSAPGEEPRVWIEVDGVATPSEGEGAVRSGTGGHTVGIGRVSVGHFDALDLPILAGRPFDGNDIGAAATAVIVNRTFVQRILGGVNALGRRIRYVGRGGEVSPEDVELRREYEIVGVVGDGPNPVDAGWSRAKVYHPLPPGDVYPATLVMRVRGTSPTTFASRLREITVSLDPRLRLDRVITLDDALREEQAAMRLTALAFALVTLSILLLSAAGIYALMSFTVTLRRREIGLRSALGADPRRVLGSIFSRALGQIALGIAVGGLLAPQLLTMDEPMDGEKAFVLLAVAGLMLAVGLLAVVGPARRGLRIQPMDALRAD